MNNNSPQSGGATRARFVGGAIATVGGLVGAGVILDALPGPARAASPEQDVEILNFALALEQIQVAFYEESARRGAFAGELAEFAKTVAAHERIHAETLVARLGKDARKPPELAFGADIDDPPRFASAALVLEDTAVAAYNSQAPNLTRDALVMAAEIVSVDARHAAWIRSILGRLPAADPVDQPLPPDRVIAAVKGTGFVKGGFG